MTLAQPEKISFKCYELTMAASYIFQDKYMPFTLDSKLMARLWKFLGICALHELLKRLKSTRESAAEGRRTRKFQILLVSSLRPKAQREYVRVQ